MDYCEEILSTLLLKVFLTVLLLFWQQTFFFFKFSRIIVNFSLPVTCQFCSSSYFEMQLFPFSNWHFTSSWKCIEANPFTLSIPEQKQLLETVQDEILVTCYTNQTIQEGLHCTHTVLYAVGLARRMTQKLCLWCVSDWVFQTVQLLL